MSNETCNNCGGLNNTPKFRACAACRALWQKYKPSKRNAIKEGISALEKRMGYAAHSGSISPALIQSWRETLKKILEVA